MEICENFTNLTECNSLEIWKGTTFSLTDICLFLIIFCKLTVHVIYAVNCFNYATKDNI